MSGLPSLSEVQPEDLAATEEDDDIARSVLVNQNIFAILTAAMQYDWLSEHSSSRSLRSGPRPTVTIGSNVKFSYCCEEQKGKVKSTSGKEACVEFFDGSRVITRSIPQTELVPDVSSEGDADNEVSDGTTNANDENGGDDPEMFDGQRHNFPPSTTHNCQCSNWIKFKAQ